MAKYLARTCPVCKGYLGVIIQPDEAENSVQAIDAHCLNCGYRIAWKLIRRRAGRFSRPKMI
jgi:C4-type Zn-finger protein